MDDSRESCVGFECESFLCKNPPSTQAQLNNGRVAGSSAVNLVSQNDRSPHVAFVLKQRKLRRKISTTWRLEVEGGR
jgi:hypothetical protein